MIYLLDTNVISEFTKPRPHPALLRWSRSINPDDCFLSAITIGEMRYGLERRRGDMAYAEQVEALAARLASMEMLYAPRILPFDRKAAHLWGEIYARYPHAPIAVDAQIAAIALANQAVLVTRDRDFSDLASIIAPFGLTLRLLNPFDS